MKAESGQQHSLVRVVALLKFAYAGAAFDAGHVYTLPAALAEHLADAGRVDDSAYAVEMALADAAAELKRAERFGRLAPFIPLVGMKPEAHTRLEQAKRRCQVHVVSVQPSAARLTDAPRLKTSDVALPHVSEDAKFAAEIAKLNRFQEEREAIDAQHEALIVAEREGVPGAHLTPEQLAMDPDLGEGLHDKRERELQRLSKSRARQFWVGEAIQRQAQRVERARGEAAYRLTWDALLPHRRAIAAKVADAAKLLREAAEQELQLDRAVRARGYGPLPAQLEPVARFAGELELLEQDAANALEQAEAQVAA